MLVKGYKVSVSLEYDLEVSCTAWGIHLKLTERAALQCSLHQKWRCTSTEMRLLGCRVPCTLCRVTELTVMELGCELSGWDFELTLSHERQFL